MSGGEKTVEGDLNRGTLRGRPRHLLRRLLLFVLGRLLPLRIEGLERVPAAGAVLVVANHLHNADPVLLEIAFPRPLHFMAKKELFGIPILSWIARRAGAFPVDRGKADRAALRRAEATLRQGIALGMFPEGTRSASRALRAAHAGAGLLAIRSGATILPVAITGSERLPGNGAKTRRPEQLPFPDPGHRGVQILFGTPFLLPREANGRRLTAEEATATMMAAIARLLPPDYRGEYAGAADESEAGIPRAAELSLRAT